MEQTEHYNLSLPGTSDAANIEVLNANTTAMDAALHSLETGKQGVVSDAEVKETPVDNDGILITDSAAGNTVKRALWSAVKTALGKVFAPLSHKHSASDVTSGVLSVARGGTGKSSWSLYRLVYANTTTSLAQVLSPTKAGSFLRANTTNAPFWSSPDEAREAMGAPKIVTGSYVGNGECGEEHPNSISFESKPKLIFISSKIDSGQTPKLVGIVGDILTSSYIYCAVAFYFRDDGLEGGRPIKGRWYGSQLQWFCTDGARPEFQMNVSGATYCYAALL